MKETILVGVGCMLSAFFLTEFFLIIIQERKAKPRSQAPHAKSCVKCSYWVNPTTKERFSKLPSGWLADYSKKTLCKICARLIKQAEERKEVAR